MALHKYLSTLQRLPDLIIPESCAVCGASLAVSSSRSQTDSRSPLCVDCFKKADESVVYTQNSLFKRCSSCGYPLTSEKDLCSRCREIDLHFEKSESIFLYSDIARTLVSEYKFSNRKGLSYYFAEKVYEYYLEYCNNEVIVPVPFRPASKRKRGWDPVGIICSILKKRYGLATADCLVRENGPAQKTLDFNHRNSNLIGRIHVRKGYKVPLKILLFDDVYTTGATMNYCSSVLKTCGAESIRCLAIAIDL